MAGKHRRPSLWLKALAALTAAVKPLNNVDHGRGLVGLPVDPPAITDSRQPQDYDG